MSDKKTVSHDLVEYLESKGFFEAPETFEGISEKFERYTKITILAGEIYQAGLDRMAELAQETIKNM